MGITGKILLTAALMMNAVAAGAVDDISLQALFKDKAIVMIDGKRRVLAMSEASPEGVKLIRTNTQQETAVIEVDGKPQTLKLGVAISATARAGSNGDGSITLYPGDGGHFLADGQINDQTVRFMVDTGATTIAMNTATAQRLGIDYRNKGQRGYAKTAGGNVPVFVLQLDKVQLGGIIEYNVDASVVEGSSIPDVLLGMSFLGRLEIKHDGGRLELIQRY